MSTAMRTGMQGMEQSLALPVQPHLAVPQSGQSSCSHQRLQHSRFSSSCSSLQHPQRGQRQPIQALTRGLGAPRAGAARPRWESHSSGHPAARCAAGA